MVDVPSGRVRARVRREQGAVASVAFANVPAYVLARGVPVPTARGELEVDLAWGGAIYACLPASEAGLRPLPEDYTRAHPDRTRDPGRAQPDRARRPPRGQPPVGRVRDDPLRGPRRHARGPPPAQRDRVRRRPGGPQPLRLGQLGARGAAGRRGPARARPGARPRLDRGHALPGPDHRDARAGPAPRRRGHRDRGHGVSDRRAPLHPRSSRSAGLAASCCDEPGRRAPAFLDAAAVARPAAAGGRRRRPGGRPAVRPRPGGRPAPGRACRPARANC